MLMISMTISMTKKVSHPSAISVLVVDDDDDNFDEDDDFDDND